VTNSKTYNRGNPLSPVQRRKRKRAEAEARNAVYAKLAYVDKLALIAARPGESKREKRRINGRGVG